MLAHPAHGARDLLGGTCVVDEIPEMGRMGSDEQASDNFLLDQGRELRDQLRLAEQQDEPMQGIPASAQRTPERYKRCGLAGVGSRSTFRYPGGIEPDDVIFQVNPEP